MADRRQRDLVAAWIALRREANGFEIGSPGWNTLIEGCRILAGRIRQTRNGDRIMDDLEGNPQRLL